MGQRIVVKIGSQVLCDPQGELNLPVLEALVRQVGRLASDGWQVLLVSSGAVAAGSSVAGERLGRVSDPVAAGVVTREHPGGRIPWPPGCSAPP